MMETKRRFKLLLKEYCGQHIQKIGSCAIQIRDLYRFYFENGVTLDFSFRKGTPVDDIEAIEINFVRKKKEKELIKKNGRC